VRTRAKTIWLLRLAMAASLLFPILLFAYASLIDYRRTSELAEERIARALDVEQEHARNVFELVDLTLDNAAELVGGMSETEIAAKEEQLHPLFAKLADAVTAVQSVWVYAKDGRALVTSTVHPPPQEQRYSERDYFVAQLDADAGIYYGGVYPSRFNGEPFFGVSRRLSHDGAFLGVLEASVLPSTFYRFFASMAYGGGLQYALLRADGAFLARYPQPEGALLPLDARTGFARQIARDAAGGFYTSASPVDDIERRFGIRRIGTMPLYLSAGIATAAIRAEWIGAMAPHLIFGIPATLVLFVTLGIVLRRTEALYREMDRRAKAEDALRQSQKMDAIGQLTGGVAHDFNNLLTIIIGNLENAQRQLEAAAEAGQAKLARRIENAMLGAQRAATLTKRLLAFSRQQPLNPTPLDVNRLLNGLVDFLTRTLGEDISLEIVGAGGVWAVETDAAELESALLNLAVNARDAMRGGGKLTIEASNCYLDDAYCQHHADIRPGQYVQIAVTDTGAGMTQTVVDRAFEPFFSTKEPGQGTGLGLSQVYGFVKQSGGHIKIYSEPGEGTTVKIYLPKLQGHSAEKEETKADMSRAHPGECILVVEDDADVRAYVVETLQRLGYHVLEAADGESALALIGRHDGNIDLLLTDVVMPGMNGRRLAEDARQRIAGLRVLFMTGYSRNAIVHQGRLDPGVELIQKPLAVAQLAAMVRKVLDA
jgi:signal transduction histidine kinase/CheY-like chemotaxis protein